MKSHSIFTFDDGSTLELTGQVQNFDLKLDNNLITGNFDDPIHRCVSFGPRTASCSLKMELTPEAEVMFRVMLKQTWKEHIRYFFKHPFQSLQNYYRSLRQGS